MSGIALEKLQVYWETFDYVEYYTAQYRVLALTHAVYYNKRLEL